MIQESLVSIDRVRTQVENDSLRLPQVIGRTVDAALCDPLEIDIVYPSSQFSRLNLRRFPVRTVGSAINRSSVGHRLDLTAIHTDLKSDAVVDHVREVKSRPP